MYNWSTDTKKLKSSRRRSVFAMEQRINYGLNKKKISRRSLKKNWSKLDLDKDRKAYFKFLLWPRKS